MKKINFLILSLLSLAFLFNACKSSSTSPSNPATGPGSSYFPNGDGTNYKYSVTKTDSSGTHSGTRSTTYNGTTTFNGVVYQNEIDTLNFAGMTEVSNSMFVKSGDSVMFAIDTSGLSAAIPSQYLQYITLSTALKVFQFPLTENKSWGVFNMGLNLSGISIQLVSVTGTYVGMDQVPLTLNTGSQTMSAAKIRYDFTLKVPNNPNNPLQFSTTTYSAFAWMADKVGMIKMQGNGAILDAFSGGGINFADTTSVITQSLVSYSIK